MFRTILRYETRLLRADHTLLLTITLFFAAMAYAGYVGHRHTTAQESIREHFQSDFESAIDRYKQDAITLEAEMTRDSIPLETVEWGVRHPYSIGSALGHTILPPPGPLNVFAVGQQDIYPSAFKVTMAGIRPLGASTTLNNPFKLLTGYFDLAFVFLYLFPLLIIGLTYGLTSHERETGLMRIILSQPVQLSTLARGKIVLRCALLTGCLLLGTAAIYLLTGTSGALMSWLLWISVTLVYGAFWVALAVFVDSRVQRAQTSALVLAVCWLIFAVVLPALISLTASTLYPVPNRMEYVTALRTESNAAAKQGAASLARFFEDHPEISPVSNDDANYAMLRVAQDARITEQLAPLEMRFQEQLSRQQNVIRAMGYLSPTVLVQQAYLNIAGTGYVKHAAFMEAARTFHETWREFFIPRYFENTPFRPADYDTLPTFTPQAAIQQETSSPLLLPVLTLLLLTGLLGFAGFKRLNRVTQTGL